MKSIVFGGNGFIGSHVVDELLKQGHYVRVFDKAAERYRDPLPSVDYVTGDFGDSVAMAEALDGMDLVIHSISTTVPSTSNRNPEADIQSNLVGTVRLLDQMLKAKISRIAYLSSGGVIYGRPKKLPVSEDHPLSPICSYGVVKIAVEKYMYMYAQLHGLKPVVLRPSNPYGPRQGHLGVQGFIATALHHMLTGDILTIWGDGSVVRDYVYVEDLAELIVSAVLSDTCGEFNVASGEGHSLNQVLETVARATDTQPVVKHEAGRGFDIPEIVLDVSLARETFNWTPCHSLHDGLSKTWKWCEKQFSEH